MASNYAFATLLTSDAYLPGALALVAAIDDLHPLPHHIPFQTVCLVTPETVDVSSIKLLRKAFNLVVGVEVIQQTDIKGLALLGRLDLHTVLTKLHVFRLTQFSKIIFLDADVLPVKPLSHLFALPHEFSAVPDVGWPDIFNSGVLVFNPGEEKFSELMNLLKSKGTWDGGDQGILNEWRGNNWNRLSFIYNTTPTAVYTYAPAYERFGSKISAIHFIGPNKPWNSLSFRPPFTSFSSPELAYDYNFLLDRWFDVYDKHYRAQPIIIADSSFEFQKYVPVWEEQQPFRIETASTPSRSVLSLEELKKVAIEGMHSVASLSGSREGEGHYVKLPLEGRVDLMRPKESKHLVPVDESGVEDTSPRSDDAGRDARKEDAGRDARKEDAGRDARREDAGPWDTRGEYSGPTDKGTHSAHDTGIYDQKDTSFIDTHWQDGNDSIDIWVQDDTGAIEIHVPSTPPRKPLDKIPFTPPRRPSDISVPSIDWQSLPTPDPKDLPPSPRPKIVSLPPTPTPYAWPTQPQISMQPPQTPPSNWEQRSAHVNSHPEDEERRPPSPPLLLWNPAVEPPPTTAPSLSAFPADTYYPNAWDQRNTGSPSQIWDNAQLFQPPPTPKIPKPLVRDGQYRQVTGEGTPGVAPSPDPSKVKHIFPWEDRPRTQPGRVFPSPENPSPHSSIQARHTSPSKSSSPGLNAPLSPLRGLPVNLAYANTWDTVPGIQRYASRLRPPRPPRISLPPLAPAFTENEWKKDVGNNAEVSSRDGDDEDSGDESSADDSDKDKTSVRTSRRLSRRSSIVSASELITGKKKQYKARGVQTAPRDVRSRGVQVNTFLVPSSSTSKTKGRMSPPGPGEISLQPDLPMSTAVPSPVGEPERLLQTLPRSLSEQKLRPLGRTIPHMASHFAQPSIQVSTVGSPSIVSRQVSNDSSAASPASSGPPNSPTDGSVTYSPIRKGGRVWDPARGVEVFKRGSEEVLARFLKMGSWEEEPSRLR